jgi:phage tail protein X
MATYVTVQGDTWDGIAFKLYGSEAYMSALIAANLSQAETVVFGAGVVLAVPEIESASVPSSLPPWKAGDGS